MTAGFDRKNLKITPETFTKVKQMFRQNKCFYPGCTNKAIKAHSIQEAGPLQTISGSVENHGSQVYCLEDDFDFDITTGSKVSKQKVSKKFHNCSIINASTFTGFCGVHDALFHEIDNMPYDGSLLHNFLYTYRTFAYSQHKQYEMFKALQSRGSIRTELVESLQNLNKAVKTVENRVFATLLKGTKISNLIDSSTNLYKTKIEELDRKLDTAILGLALEKQRFDYAIVNNRFNDFQYYSRSVNGIMPVTTACVIPYLDPIYTPSSDGIAYSPNYAVTILPEKQTGKTHFIFGVFPENPNVKLFYNKLNIKSDSELLKFMSNLLIMRGQNTYLSPDYWNSLAETEKLQIIDAKVSDEKTDLGIMDYNFNLFAKL